MLKQVYSGPSQDEIENFKMPPVRVGQPVVWHRYGEVDGRQPTVAFVLKINARNIDLKLTSGNAIGAVRHVADPKLQLSEEHRANGAWDYTEDYLKSLEEREALEKRVKTLELTVGRMSKKAQQES
jgi:hypothetical protein